MKTSDSDLKFNRNIYADAVTYDRIKCFIGPVCIMPLSYADGMEMARFGLLLTLKFCPMQHLITTISRENTISYTLCRLHMKTFSYRCRTKIVKCKWDLRGFKKAVSEL